ncbi:MAG: lipopolysaccharide assembly protein LapA domain-containing protein [Patescibacteria group bacterium]
MHALLIVAVGVLWFAITNTQEITVDVFLWYVTAPLALIIGITFISGFLVGFAQLLPGFWRRYKEASKNAKAQSAIEKERDTLKEQVRSLESKIHQISSKEDSLGK